MIETADTRQGPRWAWFGRAWLNWLGCRRRLLQADVRSVIVVMGDIFTSQAPEVLIVQRDYVIEHFATNTAYATTVGIRHDARKPRSPA